MLKEGISSAVSYPVIDLFKIIHIKNAHGTGHIIFLMIIITVYLRYQRALIQDIGELVHLAEFADLNQRKSLFAPDVQDDP